MEIDEVCSACSKPIKIEGEYEREYCCNGHDCGCRGREINPIFCDDCEAWIFPRSKGESGK